MFCPVVPPTTIVLTHERVLNVARLYVRAQFALALSKDGEVQFAEQLAKVGLSAALGVYRDVDDPEYKMLVDRFGWLRDINRRESNPNPIGDVFSAFGV